MKKTKQLTIQAGMLLVCIFMAVITLAGAHLPIEKSAQIGNFRLNKIPTGLSLYQEGGSWKYYLISSSSDYVVDRNGNWKNLTPRIDNPGRTLLTQYLDIKDHLLLYFTKYDFTQDVNADSIKVVYAPVINGNQINVVRSISGIADQIQLQGFSISYHPDDFVFDSVGNVYTENLPEDIEIIAGQIETDLTSHDLNIRRPQVTDSRTVYIVNPQLPGVIALTADDAQKIFIDKNNKSIQFEETIDSEKEDKYISNLNLKSLSNLKEAGSL